MIWEKYCMPLMKLGLWIIDRFLEARMASSERKAEYLSFVVSYQCAQMDM